jgi:hypothetical protein
MLSYGKPTSQNLKRTRKMQLPLLLHPMTPTNQLQYYGIDYFQTMGK